MSEMLDIVASAPFWVAVLRIATPLIFGTLGRAALRAGRRAQPRHRGHHGRRRVRRLAGRLPRRRPVDRRAGRGASRARSSACCTALLTVVAGAVAARHRARHHAVRDQPLLLRLPRELSEGELAADRHPIRRDATCSPVCRWSARSWARRRRSRCSRWSSCPLIAYVLYRTPVGPGRAHGRREPGGRRRPGHQRDRGAHRRHRRRQRADGRRRRVPHAVGVQRLLLQHGQRPRLDLRRAGRVRLLAAGQGAARRDPVRRLRCASAAPAAERRRYAALPDLPDDALTCCPSSRSRWWRARRRIRRR